MQENLLSLERNSSARNYLDSRQTRLLKTKSKRNNKSQQKKQKIKSKIGFKVPHIQVNTDKTCLNNFTSLLRLSKSRRKEKTIQRFIPKSKGGVAVRVDGRFYS
uniref:Uncharacterized protein n=1 Tax=Clytia hemisphaerica TaxID=252671 RepID=A0A7M5UZ73_9CNID|eukprot:TCONS_00042092-protein